MNQLPPMEKTSGIRKTIKDSFVLNIALFAYFGALFASAALPPFDTQDVQEVVQAQLQEIRENKYDDAYAKYTTVDFRHTTSLREFEKLLKDNSIFSDNLGLETRGINVKEGRSTFVGRMRNGKGSDYSIIYDLVYENNGWKIQGIRLYDR